MKQLFSVLLAVIFYTTYTTAQSNNYQQNLYMDIHYIPGGKVTFEDVAEAHKKDLAVEKKFGVHFIRYWVDEKNGIVYCLSSAKDAAGIREAHRLAHGLLPAEILAVTSGEEAASLNDHPFFLDIHELGPGNAGIKDVAAAHQKDLALQRAYGVTFINYWVNEKKGLVFCLSQAPAASKVLEVHRAAHGLLPKYIEQVKQGQ